MPESLFENRRTLASDLKLVHQAVRRGWAVPPEVRELVPIEAAKIALNQDPDLTDDDGNPTPVGAERREQIAAMRVLLAMDKANDSDAAPPDAQEEGRQETAAGQEEARTEAETVEAYKARLARAARTLADERDDGRGAGGDRGAAPKARGRRRPAKRAGKTGKKPAKKRAAKRPAQ